MKNIRELTTSLLMIAEKEGNEATSKATNEIFEHLKPLLNAAFLMRTYQKQYFQHRDKRSLAAAQKWEREFDRLLEHLRDEKQNPKLF